jgi:lysyl-tRNA synthetase class 2
VRRALGELTRLSPGTRVTVAGRVVAHDAQTCLLADLSGTARCQGLELPDAPSLAMFEGEWNGERVIVERVAHAQACVLRAADESEFMALTRDKRTKQTRLFARMRVLELVRQFFRERGFLELETQLAVPSPGLDVHLDAMAIEGGGAPRYLITSPEYQMKRLLAGGLERIVQIGKCFRNDELGERHQPEFTMLEWYRAWAGMEDVMTDTEELVAYVAQELSGGRAELLTERGIIDVTTPWPRITVREAFQRFANVELESVAEDESRFYRHMIEQVEPGLTELGAVFLCEYPVAMASLARKKPGDARVAERFEAYVAGVELCNGFGELTDAYEQRVRLMRDQRERERRGLPVYPIDERFLGALEEGIPPSGGNALGLDRLIMLALGASHIEDVLAIPGSRL